MKPPPKGTTVKKNLQREELIYIEFDFYNMTYIHELTSMLTVVCKILEFYGYYPLHPKNTLPASYASFY